jgi:hypothetical protein
MPDETLVALGEDHPELRHLSGGMQTFGGFAYAREYEIERKWRETRLYQIAPISTNLILGYVASTCSACRDRIEWPGVRDRQMA